MERKELIASLRVDKTQFKKIENRKIEETKKVLKKLKEKVDKLEQTIQEQPHRISKVYEKSIYDEAIRLEKTIAELDTWQKAKREFKRPLEEAINQLKEVRG